MPTEGSSSGVKDEGPGIYVLVRPCNGCLWQRRYIATAVLVGVSGRLDRNSGEMPRHIICLDF